MIDVDVTRFRPSPWRQVLGAFTIVACLVAGCSSSQTTQTGQAVIKTVPETAAPGDLMAVFDQHVAESVWPQFRFLGTEVESLASDSSRANQTSTVVRLRALAAGHYVFHYSIDGTGENLEVPLNIGSGGRRLEIDPNSIAITRPIANVGDTVRVPIRLTPPGCTARVQHLEIIDSNADACATPPTYQSAADADFVDRVEVDNQSTDCLRLTKLLLGWSGDSGSPVCRLAAELYWRRPGTYQLTGRMTSPDPADGDTERLFVVHPADQTVEVTAEYFTATASGNTNDVHADTIRPPRHDVRVGDRVVVFCGDCPAVKYDILRQGGLMSDLPGRSFRYGPPAKLNGVVVANAAPTSRPYESKTR